MKTVISIPDPLFKEAESLASDLGMSRSDFFTKAIASFIESQKYKSVAAQLNAVYSRENGILDEGIAKMQYESIGWKELTQLRIERGLAQGLEDIEHGRFEAINGASTARRITKFKERP